MGCIASMTSCTPAATRKLLTFMQTAVFNCTVVAARQQQQTNRGGRRTARVSTERERRALSSVTGSPAAWTELWRRRRRRGATGGQAACKPKQNRGANRDRESGRGERTERERGREGEKSFGEARGSKLDGADKDTEGGERTEKPSLTGERSAGVRAQSGKEEEQEEDETEPDRRSSLRGLDWHESEEEEEREGKLMDLIWGGVFLEGGAETWEEYWDKRCCLWVEGKKTGWKKKKKRE